MTATTNVQPEKILKDLSKLWVDLGKEDSQNGAAGVLRACAMTLIATVDQEAHAQEAAETIANLVHQHPSRVIVMRILEDHDTLEARVFAQCWMPFGSRQQICCEQIEITASKSRVADLPKLVLGIIAPDLPVVIWCRGEQLLRDSAFQHLFPLADKIIVDSAAFADALAALKFIRDFIAAGRNVADLAWTRLTPLREMVAQLFANPAALAQLKNLTKVTISRRGPDTSSTLHYLSAWLRSTLPAGVKLEHAEIEPGEPAAGTFELCGIRFTGPDFDASIWMEDQMAEIRNGPLTHRMAFGTRTDCDLLREELSVPSVDSIYRRCLA